MPNERNTMNEIAKGHIDVVDLAKRVCDVLGVQVHYSSNSNSLWLTKCGTDDEVTCVFGHMPDMLDMPDMLPASFNVTRVDDDIVSSYYFIDRKCYKVYLEKNVANTYDELTKNVED